MSKYFTGRMQLVYLDQCVVSRLIDKPESSKWKELRDALFRGHGRRNLFCPTSLEHLVETSSMPDGDAIEADKVMRALCSGWSLPLEPRLIARRIFCAVQGMKMNRGQFLQKQIWHPLSRPGTLDYLRELKAEVDADNAWRMQGANEINALVRNGSRGSGPEILRFMSQRIAESDGRKLMTAIADAIVAGRAEIFASQHNAACRDWPSTIIYTLTKEHRFRLPELKKLHSKLTQEGIAFVPTQRIKGELQAYQFAHREKVEPRDQYDLTRIGCALPYADVLITDGGKAHALRDLRLDQEFETEVFSMKEKELPALVARLQKIARA